MSLLYLCICDICVQTIMEDGRTLNTEISFFDCIHYFCNIRAEHLESGDLYDHPVWSGVGIPKAETEGRSHRCFYATPHTVITSYRLPDKGCFAFTSHCFMQYCKVSIFFVHFWYILLTFEVIKTYMSLPDIYKKIIVYIEIYNNYP